MSHFVDRSAEIRTKVAEIDALDHDRLALTIVQDIESLPPGSVIGVQGSWGRGKTDVVARVFHHVKDRPDYPLPLWINPWQYGTPDLIRPVVIELLRRMKEQNRVSEKLRLLGKTLLRAGNAMLFKAVSIVTPFGDVISAAEKPIDDLLKNLLDGDNQAEIDADPVYTMAERFKELVDEYLATTPNGQGRLLICVDDLDRCLPDHQIAMLEAIYFLTGAQAQCSFVIAIDPVLVQQAAHSHYKTTGFDSDQYLSKLFDLRLNLPSLRSEHIEIIVKSRLAQPAWIQPKKGKILGEVLQDALGLDGDALASSFARTFDLPELTNPRLVRRILDRLILFGTRVVADKDDRLRKMANTTSVFTWCAITERWPEVRQLLQAADEGTWQSNIELICMHYGIYIERTATNSQKALLEALITNSNLIARLPDKDKAPDLGAFLSRRFLGLSEAHEMRAAYQAQTIMVEYGL